VIGPPARDRLSDPKRGYVSIKHRGTADEGFTKNGLSYITSDGSKTRSLRRRGLMSASSHKHRRRLVGRLETTSFTGRSGNCIPSRPSACNRLFTQNRGHALRERNSIAADVGIASNGRQPLPAVARQKIQLPIDRLIGVFILSPQVKKKTFAECRSYSKGESCVGQSPKG